MSVIPQKRTNGFRNDLLKTCQDSDVFLFVSKEGSILSTLYHGGVLSRCVRSRADSSVSSIGINISLESTSITYSFCYIRI